MAKRVAKGGRSIESAGDDRESVGSADSKQQMKLRQIKPKTPRGAAGKGSG